MTASNLCSTTTLTLRRIMVPVSMIAAMIAIGTTIAFVMIYAGTLIIIATLNLCISIIISAFSATALSRSALKPAHHASGDRPAQAAAWRLEAK